MTGNLLSHKRGSVMSLALRKDIIIKQSNALTSAAYNLTLNEKRLVFMAIEAVNKGSARTNEFGAHLVEISTSRFCELFDADPSHVGRDLTSAAKSLNSKHVVFYLPDEDSEDGERALDAISWTTGMSYRPKRGVLGLKFNPEIIDIIKQVKQEFTMLLMIEAGRLTNPHTIRLYESLRQWCSKGHVVLSVQWICEKYGLPDSYKNRMPDFRRRFLNPSVEEITKSTNIDVKCLEIPPKKGKKTEKLLFSIIDKSKESDIEKDQLHLALDLVAKSLAGEKISREERALLKSKIALIGVMASTDLSHLV